MTDHSDLQWNHDEIAKHLRSAVDTLTPDVLERIDLTTPQEIYTKPSKVTKLYRRMRTAAAAAAACLCLALLSGGVAGYQNSRVESVIGIDVNPSIELSVNRRDKVLKAEPLNADAEEVLEDMDLKNVDLDIAVNALIGSMVRHGYLDDLDNAILVTVANDDREKASILRQDVVVDIETSLEEHKVQAVVYDQQATTSQEVRELAERYGISYGKAYFLQELVAENNLSEEDMKAFSEMTMEEIAREILERSYTVRGDDNRVEEGGRTESTGESAHENTVPSTEDLPEETEPESGTEAETEERETGSTETQTEAPSSGAGVNVTVPETTEAFEENESGGGKVRIDYVDFEDGHLNIFFKEKVKWKNPTVSVKDENGQSYSAMITDTDSESCEIAVCGLEGGMDYTFTLAGVALREGGSYGSIKGYFDTPDIAEEIQDNEQGSFDEEEEDDEEEEEGDRGATVISPSAAESDEGQSASSEGGSKPSGQQPEIPSEQAGGEPNAS